MFRLRLHTNVATQLLAFWAWMAGNKSWRLFGGNAPIKPTRCQAWLSLSGLFIHSAARYFPLASIVVFFTTSVNTCAVWYDLDTNYNWKRKTVFVIRFRFLPPYLKKLQCARICSVLFVYPHPQNKDPFFFSASSNDSTFHQARLKNLLC